MALCSEAALGPNAVPRPRALRMTARVRAWAGTGAGGRLRVGAWFWLPTPSYNYYQRMWARNLGPALRRSLGSTSLRTTSAARPTRSSRDTGLIGPGRAWPENLGQASRATPGRRTPGGAGTTADAGRGRAALSLARPGRRPDSRRQQTKRGAPGRGREATTAGRAGGREPGSCAGAVGARNGLPATANLDGTRPVRVGPRASESGRAGARGQLSRAPDRITRLGPLSEQGAPDAGVPLGRGRPGGPDSVGLGRRADGQH